MLKTSDTNNAHYFALYTDRTTTGGSDRSDYTIPDNAVSTTAEEDVVDPSKNVVKVQPVDAQLKFYTAKETVVQNSDLKWTYTAPVESPAAPAKLTAYYAGADTKLGRQKVGNATDGYTLDNSADDDIVIDITLANVGSAVENWIVKNGTATKVDYIPPTTTAVPDTVPQIDTNGLWTFYYNNDVEAGDTTTLLVDSVKLSENTTQHAFLAFDFDLNVFLESIQVSLDENGKELATSVTPWSATDSKNTAATAGTLTYNTTNTDEIDNVNWANVT